MIIGAAAIAGALFAGMAALTGVYLASWEKRTQKQGNMKIKKEKKYAEFYIGSIRSRCRSNSYYGCRSTVIGTWIWKDAKKIEAACWRMSEGRFFFYRGKTSPIFVYLFWMQLRIAYKLRHTAPYYLFKNIRYPIHPIPYSLLLQAEMDILTRNGSIRRPLPPRGVLHTSLFSHLSIQFFYIV